MGLELFVILIHGRYFDNKKGRVHWFEPLVWQIKSKSPRRNTLYVYHHFKNDMIYQSEFDKENNKARFAKMKWSETK